MREEEVRFGVTREALDALHDGVPEWMWSELLLWIKRTSDAHRRGLEHDLERRFDRLYRVAMPISDGSSSGFAWEAHEALRQRRNERVALQFVDYLLRLGHPAPSSNFGGGHDDGVASEPSTLRRRVWDARIDELEVILSESGSAWTVSPKDSSGARALVSRVTTTERLALEKTVDIAGRAGQHLLEAWRDLYGMQPDPASAHKKAILAVEAAAGHIVSPNNQSRTLGTIIATMRDQKNWNTPLKSKRTDGVQAMCEMIWTSQLSRHEGESFELPSVEQASTVVTIATALVQLFAAGLVGRVDVAAATP